MLVKIFKSVTDQCVAHFPRLQPACENIFGTIEHDVIDLLSGDPNDPASVPKLCSQYFCQQNSKKMNFQEMIALGDVNQTDSAKCELCIVATESLDVILLNPDISANILQLVKIYCDKITDPKLHEVCEKVLLYLPSAMPIIALQMNPNAFCCGLAKLCAPGTCPK